MTAVSTFVRSAIVGVRTMGPSLRIAWRLAYDPVGAFQRMGTTDTLRMGVVLLLIRWAVTPANTVLRMYKHQSPMLFQPPFEIAEQSYRFYEIFWYGPVGALIMLTITFALFLTARRFLQAAAVTPGKTFEIVSFSFFAPWVPTVPGDWLLIATVNARPEFLVPFHLTVLAWESTLVALGFRVMFGMDRLRCALLGLVAACLFLGIGSLVIR